MLLHTKKKRTRCGDPENLLLHKLARYPHSGQSSLIVMTTPCRPKRNEDVCDEPVPDIAPFSFSENIFLFFYFLLATNMKRSPRVILTHDRYGFSSLLVLVLFFHLSAVVPFLFYELLLR